MCQTKYQNGARERAYIIIFFKNHTKEEIYKIKREIYSGRITEWVQKAQ